MHRKVAAALVAVLALGVASCGGTETRTLGRAELVRQIELACREGQRTAREEAARDTGDSNFAAVIAANRLVTEKLDALDTDSAAKADLEAMTAALHVRLKAIQQVADAARSERQAVMRSVEQKATRAGREIEAAARRLGTASCN
jgi:hypothetical protein